MDKEYIRQRVAKALDAQFECYSWEQMLDDCELTPAETKWAKKHITYEAVFYDITN